MRPIAALVTLVLILGSAEAHASDKGITNEIVASCQRIFCETDIARDLAPLLAKRKQLMRSRVSREALARMHAEMDAMWRAVVEKHRASLDALPLTPRLANLDAAHLDEAAGKGWQAVRATCPKLRVPRDAVLELLRRHIPELAATPSAAPDAGPEGPLENRDPGGPTGIE